MRMKRMPIGIYVASIIFYRYIREALLFSPVKKILGSSIPPFLNLQTKQSTFSWCQDFFLANMCNIIVQLGQS